MSAVETYESRQNHSALTAWLHGYRFHHIVETARALVMPGRPLRVLELGCAYGRAYDALSQALPISYIGVDLEAEFVAEALRRYGARENFAAHHTSADEFVCGPARDLPAFDLIFALETMEHMSASAAMRTLEGVAKLAPRRFVASVPVEVGPSILLKNAGSALTGYMRHQEYSLADTLWAAIYRLDKVAPHIGGHKGFDWRWLVHSIHQVMPVQRIRRFPVPWLPSLVATNVYIEAAPQAPKDRGERP